MEKYTTLHAFLKPNAISFTKKWKEALADKYFRAEFSLSLLIQIVSLILLANFLKYVEQREGFTLNDPLLRLLEPADLTWIIFGLIYLSLAAAIISFAANPPQIILAFQAYSSIILVRIAVMYLTPFDAPRGMIPLKDPLVEFFGTGILLTKDLFFSGHTALLFLLFLIEKGKKLKIFFLASALIVGISLLIQHVHYSIDVFTAPFFSFTVFKLLSKMRPVIFKNTSNR